MMKKISLLIVSVFISLLSISQYDVDKVENSNKKNSSKFNWSTIKENIYVGGDFNAYISNTSFIYVAPFIGYEFIPSLSTGISTMIRYQTNSQVALFSRGTGVFLRFKPDFPIIIESSFNIYKTSFSGVTADPVGAKAWMLGVGYAYSMGDRSYAQFMFQYDMLKDQYVPENLMAQFPGGGRLYYKVGIVYYLSY